ncbi:MAG TPA: AtpZ/AtpI family protein [Planctomycetes bacterium]|jgi:F0F1-type ATP synthase assembly protein I|nr:AtpZ/AtpI family protein [Planctomycetota bacterium]HIL53145.1 AtpZ/AtpI family protein [Planctomycetota bacterium]
MLPKTPLDSEGPGALDAYGRYASLGIQFVVAMCFFGWIGRWADGKLGTYPWLMILGLALGAVASFISLLHSIPPVSGSPAKAREETDSSPKS